MRRVFVLIALLLGACGTSISPILPTGRDTYVVSVRTRGFFSGTGTWSEVKERALAKAISFCTNQSKHTTVVSWDTHGVRGWSTLEAELTFMCD